MKFKDNSDKITEQIGLVSIDKKCQPTEDIYGHLWISDGEPELKSTCQCGMFTWDGERQENEH